MRRIAIVCAAALACAPLASPAFGQAFVASSLVGELAPSRVITVPKDKSVAFRLMGAAGEIVVAQPDVAVRCKVVAADGTKGVSRVVLDGSAQIVSVDFRRK